MIHSNDPDTSDCSDERICSISTLLQQIGSDATADVAFRRDSTKVPRLQCGRSSILRLRNWAAEDSLQRQKSSETLIQTGRHGEGKGLGWKQG
jgi:hypothetical protein